MTRAACEPDHDRFSTPCHPSGLPHRHAARGVTKVSDCKGVRCELGLEQYQKRTAQPRPNLRKAASVIVLFLVVVCETVALSKLRISSLESSYSTLSSGFRAQMAWSFAGK